MKSRNPFISLLFVLLLFWVTFTYDPKALGQGVRKDDVTFKAGVGIAGANIAVCQPLATTAASVTANIATYTMLSNPVTAGFVQGMQIQTAGFTGADTYFNAGTIANNTLTGGQVILSVTPTTINTTLIHANASASSNGTIFQMGNPSTSCAGLSTLYTDSTLATPSGINPVVSDGLGNFGYWGAPGQYIIQVYGATVTTKLYFVSLPCVPGSTGVCVSSFSGTVANTQIVYALSPTVLSSSPNFTYNGTIFNVNGASTGTTSSLTNPTAATSLIGQSSPLFTLIGNYWTGAASAVDTYSFQDVIGNGTPTSTVLAITHTGLGGSGGAAISVGSVLSAGNITTNGEFGTAAISGQVGLVMQGTTPASAISNVSTGAIQLSGAAWNGGASIVDTWNCGGILGAGSNPTSALTCVHTGSSGEVIASIPGIMYSCGTIAAGGACVPATSNNSHCFAGIATLSGGTSVITAIAPAFTNSTSYFVTTNDLTTIANPSKGVPASGSSITFTGTGTDNISFIACGE